MTTKQGEPAVVPERRIIDKDQLVRRLQRAERALRAAGSSLVVPGSVRIRLLREANELLTLLDTLSLREPSLREMLR